jgi:hypothetical protein
MGVDSVRNFGKGIAELAAGNRIGAAEAISDAAIANPNLFDWTIGRMLSHARRLENLQVEVPPAYMQDIVNDVRLTANLVGGPTEERAPAVFLSMASRYLAEGDFKRAGALVQSGTIAGRPNMQPGHNQDLMIVARQISEVADGADVPQKTLDLWKSEIRSARTTLVQGYSQGAGSYF